MIARMGTFYRRMVLFGFLGSAGIGCNDGYTIVKTPRWRELKGPSGSELSLVKTDAIKGETLEDKWKSVGEYVIMTHCAPYDIRGVDRLADFAGKELSAVPENKGKDPKDVISSEIETPKNDVKPGYELVYMPKGEKEGLGFLFTCKMKWVGKIGQIKPGETKEFTLSRFEPSYGYFPDEPGSLAMARKDKEDDRRIDLLSGDSKADIKGESIATEEKITIRVGSETPPRVYVFANQKGQGDYKSNKFIGEIEVIPK
jgi:hypothetical protein